MSYSDDKPSQKPAGGLISAVEKGSPAQLAGIRPGMRVVSAGGHELRDRIDWLWHASEQACGIEVEGEPGRLSHIELEREPGQEWGIEFASELFDGMRLCRNDCAFCFMGMLPSGLRRSLYLRDDDFRLSFSQGNFVSLTNVTEAEVERIVEQRLSPLRMSLHAVSAPVRKRLIGPCAQRGLTVMDELLERGICLHTQIVLVPGENDGEELKRTLRFLHARPGVLSCGIVPLGYTSHQSRFKRSFDEPEQAGEVIELVEHENACDPCRHEGHPPRFQLADAFYINAGLELPPASHYGGYDLFEDGIGMVRYAQGEFEASFKEDASAWEKAAAAILEGGRRDVLLTGEAFAPFLSRILSAGPLLPVLGHGLSVRAVPCGFLGGNVNVTGLIAGADVLKAVAGLREMEGDIKGAFRIFVPEVVFNSDGLTIDDYSLGDLRRVSGADIYLAPCTPSELAKTLCE